MATPTSSTSKYDQYLNKRCQLKQALQLFL